MDNWRGIRPARQAVEYSDPGAENAAESLGRILVGELGIGAPETQFPVRVAGHVYWCDLRVGCHLFEVDGRIKYQRIEDGGVAERPLSEVIWEEKKRERAVCGVGLGMSRIIWEDFFGPARDQARARLRAEWDLTVQRFGTVLPESLAREAHQLKGLRRAG
jgi:hypothetical protein